MTEIQPCIEKYTVIRDQLLPVFSKLHVIRKGSVFYEQLNSIQVTLTA